MVLGDASVLVFDTKYSQIDNRDFLIPPLQLKVALIVHVIYIKLREIFCQDLRAICLRIFARSLQKKNLLQCRYLYIPLKTQKKTFHCLNEYCKSTLICDAFIL